MAVYAKGEAGFLRRAVPVCATGARTRPAHATRPTEAYAKGLLICRGLCLVRAGVLRGHHSAQTVFSLVGVRNVPALLSDAVIDGVPKASLSTGLGPRPAVKNVPSESPAGLEDKDGHASRLSRPPRIARRGRPEEVTAESPKVSRRRRTFL